MKESYLISKEDIMKQLSTSENGVSSKEAKKRLERDGYNELAETGKKSALLIFLEQFKDFLVIILMCAAIISGILGDFESCIVIFVVITINAEEDENGLTFIGLMAMMDPPREESKDAVAKCIAEGIKPIMITGKNRCYLRKICGIIKLLLVHFY